MNISLTPELEAFVQREVSSGQYASSSEVLRDGLRLLKHQQELLRAQIQEGLHSPRVPSSDVTGEKIADRARRKKSSIT